MDFNYETYADARMADYAREAITVRLDRLAAEATVPVSGYRPNWGTRFLTSLGILCPQSGPARA
jgi:hypothetical protein